MQAEMSKRLLLPWQQEKYFPVLFRSIFRTHHGCFSTVEKELWNTIRWVLLYINFEEA